MSASVQAGKADVETVRQLREAIWQLAHARIGDRELPRRHVATVNAFAAVAPPRLALTREGRVRTEGPDTPAALSFLARDAVDLLGGPLGHRVRECAANDCGLLFVDASPPGRRRWCSMQRCGNLAKVRAHRGRTAPAC